MRKLVVFVMLMSCVISAQAQWKVTPEAGMNVTKYKGDVAKVGFKAGAAVSYTFGSGWFSLQSGLYYVRRGKGLSSYSEIYGTSESPYGGREGTSIFLYPVSSDYLNLWGYGYGNGYGFTGFYYDTYGIKDFDVEGIRHRSQKEHREYIQLPILARFDWQVSKDVRLHLAVGPYLAVGLGGKVTYEESDYSLKGKLPYNKEISYNPFNPGQGYAVAPRFDWGATIEAGIEVKRVAFHFLENMARHHIEVYQLAKDYQAAGDKEFRKGSAYVIPVAQKYSTMVKVLMEDCLEYTDSTFYDISTWTFPYAFNLECAPVKSVAGLMGDRIERNDFPQGRLIGGESRVGYVFENREFYAPKVVYELQRKGIRVSATNRPFQFKNEEGEWTMGYGTYQVLTHNQPLPSDVLYATLGELAKNTGVDIYSANTGLMADVDFGSPAFKPLEQPKVAMLVGRGVSIPESGEIWFLLDKRFQMRPVLIENPSLTGKDLKAYNVIILANGVPNLTKGTETALKEWVAAGGVLIATGKASAWASKQGLISLKTKETLLEKADSLSVYRSFADKAEAKAGKLIKGVILNCHLDKTHPLAWGLDQDEIAVIKTNDIIFQKDRDPYVSPLYYTKKPLLSGFLSADNANLLREEPAVIVKPYKSGKVIVFADDMNFRSYFFGTSKLFMNALFYNKCM